MFRCIRRGVSLLNLISMIWCEFEPGILQSETTESSSLARLSRCRWELVTQNKITWMGRGAIRNNFSIIQKTQMLAQYYNAQFLKIARRSLLAETQFRFQILSFPPSIRIKVLPKTLIPISSEADGVNIWYLKLRLFDMTEYIV